MTDNVQFSDDLLTAYLDGEADAELCALFTAALEADVQLGDRLARLEIPIAVIAQGYTALLDQAPAMPVLPIQPATPTRQGFGIWGAVGVFGTGIAAGLVMAVYTGFGTSAPKEPSWQAVVASYQSLYSKETLADRDIDAAGAELQLSYVSKMLGAD